jgi:hypothetical protein
MDTGAALVAELGEFEDAPAPGVTVVGDDQLAYYDGVTVGVLTGARGVHWLLTCIHLDPAGNRRVFQAWPISSQDRDALHSDNSDTALEQLTSRDDVPVTVYSSSPRIDTVWITTGAHAGAAAEALWDRAAPPTGCIDIDTDVTVVALRRGGAETHRVRAARRRVATRPDTYVAQL